MKTRIIALTLFTGVALLVGSCVNEKEYNRVSLDKDEVAFRIASVQTKSDSNNPVVSSENIASFSFGKGEQYSLEETVEYLDGMPGTKGTPAFTENVLALYGSFIGVANPGGNNSLPESEFSFDEARQLWSHYYGGNVWAGAPFKFYMRMPYR